MCNKTLRHGEVWAPVSWKSIHQDTSLSAHAKTHWMVGYQLFNQRACPKGSYIAADAMSIIDAHVIAIHTPFIAHSSNCTSNIFFKMKWASFNSGEFSLFIAGPCKTGGNDCKQPTESIQSLFLSFHILCILPIKCSYLCNGYRIIIHLLLIDVM